MPPHPTKPSNSSSTPKAAQPTRKFFDPWNSSSTGHQRADNILSGSTSWRDSRNRKLAAQYKGGFGGGERVADSVGAGSPDFGKDGRKANGGWEKGRAPKESGQRGIMEFGATWGVKADKANLQPQNDKKEEPDFAISYPASSIDSETIAESEPGSPRTHKRVQHEDSTILAGPLKPQIFSKLTFYVNGSTAPYISDHKLRHLLAQHGANTSIGLARRQVTHVILGTPSSHRSHTGAGGGLAGSKIQKEIQRIGGKGVKFISAEWVVESVKAGRRLPETRFAMDAGIVVGRAKGQGSVWNMLQHHG